MLNQVGGRKFILALLALAALCVLCWAHRVDGTLFITGLTVTVGSYLTANVAQKKVQKDPQKDPQTDVKATNA